MKEQSCNCKCILTGRKFLNEDMSVNRTKLAVIFERWFKEQLSINIEEMFAYGVINSYARNLCDCECHVMESTKEAKKLWL